MRELKDNIIKVYNPEGDSIELTFNWDADGDEWKQIFKTILYWKTFPYDTIKSIFNEEEDI